MSGGVDSAVAASLLQSQGWEVGGVTFKLFCYGEAGASERACCGLEGVRDAQATARRLGLSHTVLDLSELFREQVIEDFTREYGRGRTPNPCVQCNTHVKFAPLLDWARRQGYDHIATGHYARRQRIDVGGESRTLIARARHPEKDQSYVLWGVPAPVLDWTLFPLGELTKEQARSRAQERALPVWDKAESQDICFVEEGDYAAVLRQRLGEDHAVFRPGDIVDAAGRKRGTHAGLAHYTVGQRKGLQLPGPEPLRVLKLDPERNLLVVGPESELLCGGLEADELNLFVPEAYVAAAAVEVKIRYRHEPAPARAEINGGVLRVLFDSPQPSVAPGQSCVVYRDGGVLAGGKIRAAL